MCFPFQRHLINCNRLLLSEDTAPWIWLGHTNEMCQNSTFWVRTSQSSIQSQWNEKNDHRMATPLMTGIENSNVDCRRANSFNLFDSNFKEYHFTSFSTHTYSHYKQTHVSKYFWNGRPASLSHARPTWNLADNGLGMYFMSSKLTRYPGWILSCIWRPPMATLLQSLLVVASLTQELGLTGRDLTSDMDGKNVNWGDLALV